jgi:hypothetical protein
MPTLPQGEDLKKALREYGIATDGFEKNANGQPFEAVMQERLLEVLRDEREERAVKNAEALTRFTRNLVRATWVMAFATCALIVTGIAQILITLGRK